MQIADFRGKSRLFTVFLTIFSISYINHPRVHPLSNHLGAWNDLESHVDELVKHKPVRSRSDENRSDMEWSFYLLSS
jgi:hypothetical protein